MRSFIKKHWLAILLVSVVGVQSLVSANLYTQINKVAMINSIVDNTPIGSLTPSTAAFTTATANSFVGPLAGNASTASTFQAAPSRCASSQYATGVDIRGNAYCTAPFQTVKFGVATGCNTGTAAGNTCAVNVNWTTGAFPDSSYYVACSGINPNNVFAYINAVNKLAGNGGVQVVTGNGWGTDRVSGYSTITCIAAE